MTEPLIVHFQMMARYNRRADERLYDACTARGHEARKRDRKAFFASTHGTLNHIEQDRGASSIIESRNRDRIWLGRFAGRVMSSGGLDAILYEDFAGLDPAFMAGSITYHNDQGRDLSDPAATMLAYFFNHQTHHRGQVHDMLSQAGVAPSMLDLHQVRGQ